MNKFHTPVLLTEVLELLDVQTGKKYIDATLGGGGHAEQIVGAGGVLLGIDRDPEALMASKKRLESAYPVSSNDANKARGNTAFRPFKLVQGNFEKITEVAHNSGFTQVSGILFDLGASTHQLLSPTRGFSFQFDAPLDMRMDPNLGVTARDLINALGKKELYDLFTNLAQEERARAITADIISARSQKPIETTGELARLVEKIYRGRRGKLHSATKVFQALRIAVNDELYALTQALPQALKLLEPTGRLVIISFHEGEDRIVKRWLKTQAENNTLSIITQKPLQAQADETTQNPNARSAKLRAAIKK